MIQNRITVGKASLMRNRVRVLLQFRVRKREDVHKQRVMGLAARLDPVS